MTIGLDVDDWQWSPGASVLCRPIECCYCYCYVDIIVALSVNAVAASLTFGWRGDSGFLVHSYVIQQTTDDFIVSFLV